MNQKMDLIATIKDGFNGVTKRQMLCNSISQVVIDRVCEVIVETLIQILSNNSEVEQESAFTLLRHKLDSLVPILQLQGFQKETNTSLAKFEKVLEKSFHPDVSEACRSIDFDIKLVNKMLIEYFYRQGLFEVGDCLVKEAEVELESEVRSQCLEFHKVTESLKLKNIEPAMRWISTNRGKLKQDGSHGTKLEMKLISLKYREMLRQGKSSEAFKFARTHFPKLSSLYFEQIQKLFTALLWVGNLEKCPYIEVLSSLCWDSVTKELTKQYYHLLDQPSNSSLAVTLSAGLQSLPTLLKLIRVMGLKKQEWEEMKQLPFDVELGDEFQFHSVFVCPVSREESNEDNPAMMMPCRHVLCKQSIMRLSKNCPSRRFQCPYCPAQTTATACRPLYF